MKHWILATLVASVSVALVLPSPAEASKRVGGGKSVGMQRSAPAQGPAAAPTSTPPQQAAPQQAAPKPAAAPQAQPAAAAAAAPAKRNWMGPLAGLAAGLGIAALLSHFGLGEAAANFMMMALLAVAVFLIIAFVMRRLRGGSQPTLATAGAGAGAGSLGSAGVSPSPAARAEPAWAGAQESAPLARNTFDTGAAPVPASSSGSGMGGAPAAFSGSPAAGGGVSVTGQPLPPLAVPGAAAAAEEAAHAAPASATAAAPAAAQGPALPPGFDLPAFERVAKMIFIRLQAANDKADLEDLRQFTTPEMFAALRLDLQDRGSAPQTTDVERVDAQVVDFAQEGERQVVSVRFHGLIREEVGAPTEAFDEVWHLVRPQDQSQPWAIAGIQQSH